MRLPILPTLFVAAAVITMLALGVWQLGRAEEKDALIARYARADTAEPIRYPANAAAVEDALYRQTRITCERVLAIQPTAGTSATGAKGWGQRARCQIAEARTPVLVDIGWSRRPEAAEWSGGTVSGTLAPGGRVVAAEPLAGLQPLARPDPRDLPDNHLAYAGQWFFFALTALVIYWLALRRRGE